MFPRLDKVMRAVHSGTEKVTSSLIRPTVDKLPSKMKENIKNSQWGQFTDTLLFYNQFKKNKHEPWVDYSKPVNTEIQPPTKLNRNDVENIISSHKVVIFTKNYCSSSLEMKSILKRKKYNFHEVKIDEETMN